MSRLDVNWLCSLGRPWLCNPLNTVSLVAEIMGLMTLGWFLEISKLDQRESILIGSHMFIFFFFQFLLGIFFLYISNAIPKVPHTLPYPPTTTSWPWCSPVLGHIKFARPRDLSSQWCCLGHLLIHMQLKSRAPGYWLVHNVVPPKGLQFPLGPWVLSLAPPLGALWSIH